MTFFCTAKHHGTYLDGRLVVLTKAGDKMRDIRSFRQEGDGWRNNYTGELVPALHGLSPKEAAEAVRRATR